MANKAGSDGQIRKTTAQWAVDTDTYPEGMRLMDTTTGTVRVSKGTTYALAWVATAEGATATGIHHGPYEAGITLNFHDTVSYQDQIFEWQGGETVSTNWATDASFFGINIAINEAFLDAALAADLPKRYKWIGDGGAATGTVVANTLGVTINVTNPAEGQYVFTAASGAPFTVGKTTIQVQNLSNDGALRFVDAGLESTSVCDAHFTKPDESAGDPAAYQVIIEVEP